MKTIIFDFGSVLFTIDVNALYSKYFDNKADLQHFRTNILTPQIRSSFNYGSALPELKKLAKKYPKYKQVIMAVYNEFDSIITGVMPGMEEVLQELTAQDITIYGLTNWAADHYLQLEKLYPEILAYMKGVIVSGREGIKKPDPIFFKVLLNRYNIDPKTAVFVDDKKANVRTANYLGMDGILFTDTKSLVVHLNTTYNLNINQK